MCIAILKPANTLALTDEELSCCRDNNKDGFGYAFVGLDTEKQENYVVVKTFMEYDKFLESYRKDEVIHTETPFLIHFRATSAGTTSLENCHPFSVNRHIAFMHNGTMGIKAEKGMSDTAIFNEYILKELPDGWFNNDAISFLLEDFVGHGKLVFLASDFTYKIIGEKKGHWRDGMWFSNNDYKTNRRVVYHNDYSGWNRGKWEAGYDNDLSFKVMDRWVEHYKKEKYVVTKYGDGSHGRSPYNKELHQDIKSYKWVDMPTLTTTWSRVVHNNDKAPTSPPGKENSFFLDDESTVEDTFECAFCSETLPISEKNDVTWFDTYTVCSKCAVDLFEIDEIHQDQAALMVV